MCTAFDAINAERTQSLAFTEQNYPFSFSRVDELVGSMNVAFLIVPSHVPGAVRILSSRRQSSHPTMRPPRRLRSAKLENFRRFKSRPQLCMRTDPGAHGESLRERAARFYASLDSSQQLYVQVLYIFTVVTMSVSGAGHVLRMLHASKLYPFNH